MHEPTQIMQAFCHSQQKKLENQSKLSMQCTNQHKFVGFWLIWTTFFTSESSQPSSWKIL